MCQSLYILGINITILGLMAYICYRKSVQAIFNKVSKSKIYKVNFLGLTTFLCIKKTSQCCHLSNTTLGGLFYDKWHDKILDKKSQPMFSTVMLKICQKKTLSSGPCVETRAKQTHITDFPFPFS